MTCMTSSSISLPNALPNTICKWVPDVFTSTTEPIQAPDAKEAQHINSQKGYKVLHTSPPPRDTFMNWKDFEDFMEVYQETTFQSFK